MLKADVVVLGAGMVGVSAALHLQARGREVVLVDRHGAAGLETSFGNAGLIERSSIYPRVFPRAAQQARALRAEHAPRGALSRNRAAGYRALALPLLRGERAGPPRDDRRGAARSDRALPHRARSAHGASRGFGAAAQDRLDQSLPQRGDARGGRHGSGKAPRIRSEDRHSRRGRARPARAASRRRGRRRALSRHRLSRRAEPRRPGLRRSLRQARRAFPARRRAQPAGGRGWAVEPLDA